MTINTPALEAPQVDAPLIDAAQVDAADVEVVDPPPADIEKILRADLEKFKAAGMTPEQEATYLREAGLTPEANARTPDEKKAAAELDAEFPAGAPIDELQQVHPKVVENGQPAAKALEFIKENCLWASEIGLTKGIAGYVFSEFDKTFEMTRGMSPPQLEIWRRTEEQKAARTLGPDWQKRLATANERIDIVEKMYPGLKEMLAKSNGCHSSTVAIYVVEAAERLAARAARLSKR